MMLQMGLQQEKAGLPPDAIHALIRSEQETPVARTQRFWQQARRNADDGDISLKRPGLPQISGKTGISSGDLDKAAELMDQQIKEGTGEAEGAAQKLAGAFGPKIREALTGLVPRIVSMTTSEVIRNMEFDSARN